MPRLFIGIALPEPITAQLKQQQDYFGLVLDKDWFKFTKPEQQHLTLSFLGAIDESNVERIKQALRFACRKQTTFDLSTARMGAFPSTTRPSILWTAVNDPSNTLQNLQHKLKHQLEGLYKAEKGRYKPHLTLARVKRFGQNESIYNALMDAPDYPPTSWSVDAIHLYSSRLLKSGAEYTIVHSETLATKGSQAQSQDLSLN